MIVRPLAPVRRFTRHVVRAHGEAVTTRDFRLLGRLVLDASAEGCLLACDDGVTIGDDVILTFRVPGSSEWFDAEARVARIVEGNRYGDPGYCAGLVYTRFDRRERLALGVDLRSFPLVPAQRSYKFRLRDVRPR